MNQYDLEQGYTHKSVLLDVPPKVMEYADAVQQFVPVPIRDNMINNMMVVSLPLVSDSPDKTEPLLGPDEAYGCCIEDCVIDKTTGEITDMESHDPGRTNTELLAHYIPPDATPKIKQLAFEAHDELTGLWANFNFPPEARLHAVRTVSETGVLCDFAIDSKSLPNGG